MCGSRMTASIPATATATVNGTITDAIGAIGPTTGLSGPLGFGE
jgi:hypothetical protein